MEEEIQEKKIKEVQDPGQEHIPMSEDIVTSGYSRGLVCEKR